MTRCHALSSVREVVLKGGGLAASTDRDGSRPLPELRELIRARRHRDTPGEAQSETFDQAVARISGAIGRITSGEAMAYIDCWAQADEATPFGAWGPIEKGHQTVADTLTWVGEGSAVLAFKQR